MEIRNIIMLLIGLAVIFTAIGMAIHWESVRNRDRDAYIGTLRVDSSDPDGEYLFLELDKPLAYVKGRKWAIMRVDISSYSEISSKP